MTRWLGPYPAAEALGRTLFGTLDERIMLAAQPSVAISGDATALIGQQPHVTLSFSNSGDATGYFPYIDLIVPKNGADGAGVGNAPINDGLSFVSASYMGSQVTVAAKLEFDASGNAVHPFARDAYGALRVVHAQDYGAAAGDQLVVLQLPFGSFTPPQTTAVVDVTLDLSSFADIDKPLVVSAVGGFAFGQDPSNNPIADHPLLGPASALSVTPTVVTLSKHFSGPEGETATGPNFPQSYTLALSIAKGQELSAIHLDDQLADGLVVLSYDITSKQPGTITYDAASHRLSVDLTNPVTGSGGTDVTVKVGFYVGEYQAPTDPTAPVLDPATGAPRGIVNNLSASATWTPIDPRDQPTSLLLDPAGPENTFAAKSLAVQKTVAVAGHGGSAVPGDTLEWTINGQISDYFTLDALVLQDAMTKGQSFDAGFVPSLIVVEQGVTIYSGVFDASHYSVVPDATTGGSVLRLDLNGLLDANHVSPVLKGGMVGGGHSGTTFEIKYHSVVDRYFDPAESQPLVQGDRVHNSIKADAEIFGSTAAVTDGSSAGVNIARGGSTKTIWMVNDALVSGTGIVSLTAGDTITYRLQYDMPIGSAYDLKLVDYLPLPILRPQGDGGAALTFLDVVSDGGAGSPGVGTVWWNTSDTYHSLQPEQVGPDPFRPVPQVKTDPYGNSITLDFGSFYMPTPQPVHVDLLLRLRVEDKAFGDGLLLTNQLTAFEHNTPMDPVVSGAIVQIQLNQAELHLTKGVVGVVTGQSVFGTSLSPATVGPVPFDAPGTAVSAYHPSFTGAITSAGLLAKPVNSNLSGVDAGDLVRFAVVVENTGHGRNGVHDLSISDLLPAGLTLEGDGNLGVWNGAGVALAHSGDLFASGITITDPTESDPANPQGALAMAGSTGSNILVITYDAKVVDTTLVPWARLTNTAKIETYAAHEGGTNFAESLLPSLRQDDASVTTGHAGVVKALVSTSLNDSASSGKNLLIGETATFNITVTFREGVTQDVMIRDIPQWNGDGKLDLISAELRAVGGNLTMAHTPATGALAIVDANGDGINNEIRITLGDVTNRADNAVTADDQITLTVVARLRDRPENASGDVLTNIARLSYKDANNNTGYTDGSATITVIEPVPRITKDVSAKTADGGDTVTYTVTVSNDAGAPASLYDISISDLVSDSALRFQPGSVTSTAGTIVHGNGAADTAIDIALEKLAPGEKAVITYQAILQDKVASGAVIHNTATLHGSSAPGVVDGERGYTLDGTATVTVPQPVLLKTVLATSLNAGSAQDRPGVVDVTIGETVTYQLVITFSDGVSTLVLDDQLPVSGGAMQYLGYKITDVGQDLDFNKGEEILVASDTNGDGVTDHVRISFGTVTNAVGSSASTADQIILTVNARLLDRPVNTAGDRLDNTARLTSNGTELEKVIASIDVVEPVLSIAKSAPPAYALPGETIGYTVTVKHDPTSTAQAFDLHLSDLLNDPNLELVAGSVTATIDGAAAGNIVTGNTAGDDTIRIDLGRLAMGKVLEVHYSATVSTAMPGGSTMVNTAKLAYDSLNDGSAEPGRAYAGQDIAEVPGAPSLTKAVLSTSLSQTGSDQHDGTLPDLAIGEEVTYRLVLTLPLGTTNALILTDALPDGLEPMAAKIGIGSGLSVHQQVVAWSGQTYSVDFGDVSNGSADAINADDQIIVDITARVRDVSGNADGTQLTNTAETGFKIGGRAGTLSAVASTEVVLPVLLVDKQVDKTSGDAGDVFTYTVTLRHAGASTSAAFDLALQDTLSSTLHLDAASSTAGSVAITGNRLTLSLGHLLRTDAPVVLTYTAHMTDTVEHGQVLPNTALLSYSSAPTPGGRAGAAQDDASITGQLALGVDKAIIGTSLSQTGSSQFDPNRPDLAIGERVTYRLVAHLGEGTQRLVLEDVLPAGLVAESASLDALGSGVKSLVQEGLTVAAQQVVLTALVVTTGDNDTTNDTVALLVTARVADVASNQAGTVLVNQASAAMHSPGVPAHGLAATAVPVAADVVLPVLAIDKTVSTPQVAPGMTVTYTLTLSHMQASTAAAFDVTLQDLMADQSVRLVAGSVTTTSGQVVAGNGAGDRLIVVRLDELALGQSATVRFAADVVAVPAPDGLVHNTGTYSGFTSPGGPSGQGRGLSGNDTAVLQVAASGPGTDALRADLFGWEPEPRRAPVLPLAPAVFSGTAQPGSVLQVAMRDQHGAPAGVVSGMVDVGGNWLVSVPAFLGATPDLPDARAALQDSVVLRRTETLDLPRTEPTQIFHASLHNGPFGVVGRGTDMAIAPAAQDGVRLSFGGAVLPSGTFTGPADSIPRALAGVPDLISDLAGLRAPQSLAWNRFALDFAAGSVVAGTAAR